MSILLFLALAQDGEEPKVIRGKEFDQKVQEAIRRFREEYGDSEEGKLKAIERLVGLVHERAVQELARCFRDSDQVVKRAIEVASELDHPAAGELLSSAIPQCLKTPEMTRALVKAADKCRWNRFLAELSAKVFEYEKVGEKGFGEASFELMQTFERFGPAAPVEPLITLLRRVEDLERTVAALGSKSSNEGYVKQLRATLKACTGQDKATAKEYEDWWRRNKDHVMMTQAKLVLWCRTTGQRWERKASDPKSSCPHHADRKEAQKDPLIVAYISFR